MRETDAAVADARAILMLPPPALGSQRDDHGPCQSQVYAPTCLAVGKACRRPDHCVTPSICESDLARMPTVADPPTGSSAGRRSVLGGESRCRTICRARHPGHGPLRASAGLLMSDRVSPDSGRVPPNLLACLARGGTVRGAPSGSVTAAHQAGGVPQLPSCRRFDAHDADDATAPGMPAARAVASAQPEAS